jgi:hypothetical protein
VICAVSASPLPLFGTYRMMPSPGRGTHTFAASVLLPAVGAGEFVVLRPGRWPDSGDYDPVL